MESRGFIFSAPLAYKLKFASKRDLERDYVVPPLEALWWAADMAAFTSARDKSQWSWTAMIMTTMGSEYWPQTSEGRVLCFFLALYSFAMFGYVTATLATFFIGRDADNPDAELPGTQSIDALRVEIMALRDEIRRLNR